MIPSVCLNQVTKTGTKKTVPGPYRFWILKEESSLCCWCLGKTPIEATQESLYSTVDFIFIAVKMKPGES